MLYYRFTDNHHDPMSDAGHAMFTADRERISQGNYGSVCYTLDSKHCIPIDDLSNDIMTTWDTDKKDCFEYTPFMQDQEYWLTIDGCTIANLFNPNDIVDSAGAWDNIDLVYWIWERIAEPRNIMAISTKDGAICFDAELIKKEDDAE